MMSFRACREIFNRFFHRVGSAARVRMTVSSFWTRNVKIYNRFLHRIGKAIRVEMTALLMKKINATLAVAIIIGIILGVSPAARALFGMSRGGATSNGGQSVRQPSALGDSAVAYYPFDDGANDKAPVNRNNLTDNNTVTQAAGRTPNGAQFTRTNSESLTMADNASLSTGDIDFSTSAWVYLDSKTGHRDIVTKWRSGTNQREYALIYQQTFDRFEFYVSSNGTAETAVTANNFGSPSTSTWYFIVAWHDATNNQLGISVNNGTADTSSYSSGVFDSTANFGIGGRDTSNIEYMDGRIDNVGFWKRTLSTEERTWMYEGGRGRGYSELTDGYKTSLQAYWDLNELSGNRSDSYGSNTLTDNNTVTFAAGVNQTKAQKAALFSAASSEYLSVADNAGLSIGNNAFSIATWVYGTNVFDGSTRYFLSKYSASNVEYYLGKNDTDRRLFFVISGDGTSTTLLQGPAMVDDVWYFVVAWYDPDADTVNLQVNNGSVTSASQSTGIYDGSAQLSIGGLNGASNFWNGRADNTAMWKRVLTTDERTALYNSGLGKDYRELDNGIKKNLTSWWDLDEPSGTRNDAHAYSGLNTGTATSVTQTTGKFSNAYTFNGTSSQISVTDSTSLNPGSALTLSAWAKPNGASEAGYILAKGNGSTGSYWIYWDGANDYIQGVGDSGCNSNAVFTDNGEWVHIAIVNDNSTMTFYRNGVAAGSCGNGVNTTADNLVIGNRPGGTTAAQYFTGDIDDIRIYSRALSATEIARQFNGSKPTPIDNTASAYYKMDEASGSVAKDSSHGSNNPNPLADNNTVTQATGRQPSAAQFTAANTEYLSINDNAPLSTGDIDFSIAAWFYLDSLPTDGNAYRLVTKYTATGNNRDYLTDILNSGGNVRARFAVTGDGVNATVVTANTFGNLSINTWYYMTAWHDATGNTINIAINGTSDSTSHTTGVFDGTGTFRIGLDGEGSFPMNGRIANVGFWKKVLTSTERTSLYNGGAGKMYHDLSASEKTSLQAYWNLNEASGTRSDSHSTNNLTDNNTVTAKPNTAYKDSDTAAQFTSANSEYLSVNDNASVSTGDIDFSIAGWFYFDSLTPAGLISKWSGVASTQEYVLYYSATGGNTFDFYVGNGSSNNHVSSTSPVVGTWYFVVAWHDSAANTINIQVNNGSVVSASHTTGVLDGTNAFQFGKDQGSSYHNGRISNVGLWKKVLSSNDRTSLYNGGAGRNYNQLSVNDKDKLVSYWNLDESSGDRADSQGSNTLTDNNTVTANSSVPSARYANAGQFTRTNSEYLSISDNASLSIGDIDFTFSAWVYLDSKPSSNLYLITKAPTTNTEYALLYNNANGTEDRFQFFFTTGGTSKTVSGTTGLSTGVWYFVVAWHDAAGDTVNLQVNDGTAASAATAGLAPTDTANTFRIGSYDGTQLYQDGRIDNVGFWKRTLTSGERTALYNYGIGKSYSDLTSSEKATLISYWDLDEASGARSDIHGGNSGYISGATVGKEGVFGNAYSLDGTDDYIDLGDQASLESSGDNFTLSAWIKTSGTPTSRMIMAKKDNTAKGYYMWVSASGKLESFFGDGTTSATATSTASINDNAWHHVAAVRSTNTVTIYIDGAQAATNTAGGTLGDLSNTLNARIGRSDHSAGPYYFAGTIDDARIYTRALTANEIVDQYNAGAKQL